MMRSILCAVLLLGLIILGPPVPARAQVEATSIATPAATPTATGQWVLMNGAELYYEVHGPADGPPLLLLHGGLSSAEDWANQVPAFVAAGYRVILLDTRAHGRSSWGEVPLTYEQMAADALGLLDHLGIAQTDLVGWSDGAVTGLELAVHHPERLRKLVAYGANFTPEGIHDATPTAELVAGFAQLAANYQRLSPHPERFEELLGTLFALYEVAPNFSQAELQGITVSTLVLGGAEEELVYPAHTAQLAELIPGAELVIMPGTGHFAPLEHPEEFNRIVLEFLAS